MLTLPRALLPPVDDMACCPSLAPSLCSYSNHPEEGYLSDVSHLPACLQPQDAHGAWNVCVCGVCVCGGRLRQYCTGSANVRRVWVVAARACTWRLAPRFVATSGTRCAAAATVCRAATAGDDHHATEEGGTYASCVFQVCSAWEGERSTPPTLRPSAMVHVSMCAPRHTHPWPAMPPQGRLKTTDPTGVHECGPHCSKATRGKATWSKKCKNNMRVRASAHARGRPRGDGDAPGQGRAPACPRACC